MTIFPLIAAAALLAGCTDTPKYMGAAVDHDQNVLTGGPITGTTIDDLPKPVKQTLMLRVPHAEIASIEKTHRGAQVVYEISFLDADQTDSAATPDLSVRQDGMVMPELMRAQR